MTNSLSDIELVTAAIGHLVLATARESQAPDPFVLDTLAARTLLVKLKKSLEARETSTAYGPDSLHGKLDQILKALPVKPAELQRRDVSILILRRAIMGVLDISAMAELDDVETGVLAVPGPEADKAVIRACVQALKDTTL